MDLAFTLLTRDLAVSVGLSVFGALIILICLLARPKS